MNSKLPLYSINVSVVDEALLDFFSPKKKIFSFDILSQTPESVSLT